MDMKFVTKQTEFNYKLRVKSRKLSEFNKKKEYKPKSSFLSQRKIRRLNRSPLWLFIQSKVNSSKRLKGWQNSKNLKKSWTHGIEKIEDR